MLLSSPSIVIILLIIIVVISHSHPHHPPVKFMQGQIGRCVFSSLTSAFDHTTIPDLVRVAKILQDKSNMLSGGSKCLNVAMHIVAENVKWLQPKRLPKTFNWENDMNNYMFDVGVIQDSTNSCQHAVTIFCNWISPLFCHSAKKVLTAAPGTSEMV